MSQSTIYSFSVKGIKGEDIPLLNYTNQVLLIVNVASQCGFTPQYKGLETLYQSYKNKGFSVLGFPCNQFGGQEPGTETQIQEFCELKFGVSFPLFSKVDVNGPDADPLFEYLKKEKKGVLGTEAIKWNFTKFLVDRKGQVFDRFASTTKPEDLVSKIEELL